jgi:hypothetical protein
MILIELAIGLVALCFGIYFALVIIAKMDKRFKIAEKIKEWFK